MCVGKPEYLQRSILVAYGGNTLTGTDLWGSLYRQFRILGFQEQGVFLFSGAEGRTFEDSLEMMMQDTRGPWHKRFRNHPAASLPEIEEELFQLNIHELSLFPDTEGLAGFVRQKLRLHW